MLIRVMICRVKFSLVKIVFHTDLIPYLYALSFSFGVPSATFSGNV